MENAADALKMAAAVLIFIIAIASSFSLFGTAKQTADSIIGMRDKQAYLEAAELDNGILYTSSSAISGDDPDAEITTEYVSGVTSKGDRVVSVDDVVSTIYRYSKEKYGVTIIKNSEVIARFDSATEYMMSRWNEKTKDEYGNLIPVISDSDKTSYKQALTENLITVYEPSVDIDLEDIYRIGSNKVGAPWYGNNIEIEKRINKDLSGDEYKYNGQTYQGKGLLEKLSDANQIIEVTNEIDQSKYVSDTNDEGEEISTNLLEQYKMPTIEIVYILY